MKLPVQPASKPAPPLAERLHAALPQTQCTRCGYPDCAAYAHAIASEGAAINQCPPGGAEGIARLAALTGQPVIPLNPVHGTEGPRSIAVIDESWCIGCTLCIKVCPTDAILGSHKMMHTVIEPDCTGCELCIPVCPVDCITLENVTGTATGWAAWSEAQAHTALSRYQVHTARIRKAKDTGPKKPGAAEKAAPQEPAVNAVPAREDSGPAVADRKRAVIEAALARARAQRNPKA